MEDVYNFEPTPDELSAEEQKYVLGAQANLWSEYIPTPKDVEYMILPRMTALSEVVWTKKDAKDWNDFSIRLNAFAERLDVLGLNYATHSLNKK